MVRTDEQREQHRQYVARRRQEEGYKEKENEARVLLRIQDGSIPHADSLEKFNITLAQINYIRGQNDLEPIKEQIPYFMKAKVNRAFDPQNYQTFVPERVEPEERPPPPQDITASYGFSVAEITLWMRENPTRVGTKSNLTKKPGTIKKQFGAMNSPTTTGQFYNFMDYLGATYVADVRKVLRRSAIEHIRKKVNTPRKSELTKTGKLRKGQAEFMTLGSTIQQLSTLLIVLREYPGFDALCNDPNKRPEDCDETTEDAYNKINRIYTQLEAREKAEQYANPKENKEVEDYDTLVRKVERKFKKGTKEFLYIKMYSNFVSRDDFKNLQLRLKAPPKSEDELEKMSKDGKFLDPKGKAQNALYIYNKKATLALVDYKTSSLYGVRLFTFPDPVSKLILEYIKANKLKDTLFGKSGMSEFVKKMLDEIGIPTDREGNINYLRKSYISTALAKEPNSEKVREELAYHLKHSPSASLKYIREIVKDDPSLKFENIPKEKLDEVAEVRDLDDTRQAGKRRRQDEEEPERRSSRRRT